MKPRSPAFFVVLLASAPIFAQESEERTSPVQIRSITLHEEGKKSRPVDVQARPRDIAVTNIGDFDGEWAVTEDTGGGLLMDNQPVIIRTAADGSIAAEFPSEMNCPDSSGARTRYLKGQIEGGTIVGSIDRCSSKAYVKQCGDAGVYTTGFRADIRDADTIVGQYTGTGYRITAGGCIEDSAYDVGHTFELRRRETAVHAAAARRELPPSQCGPVSQRPDRNAPQDPETPDNGWTYHPVHLNAYCRAEHGDSALAIVQDEQDAYSWRCQVGDAGNLTWHEVSVEGACALQSPWAESHLENSCDPYSWSCAMPPSELVYVWLDRIEKKYTGGGSLELDLSWDYSFTIKVRHESPDCGEGNRPWYICESWELPISDPDFVVSPDWQDGNYESFHEIDLTHPFRIYRGSRLVIGIRGIEDDLIFDDKCKEDYVVVEPYGQWTEEDGRTDCVFNKHHYFPLVWKAFKQE